MTAPTPGLPVLELEPVPVREPAREPARERSVGVLLIEHDPISRHVIQQHLHAAPGIDLVASLDRCGTDAGCPGADVDLAVIACGTASCCSTAEGLLATVNPLLAAGVDVLMLGTRWSRELIDRLVEAGVTGYLVKRPSLEGLSAGIRAVSAGQGVISPELLQSYWGRRPPVLGSAPGRHRLTEREREVLALLGQGVSTREAAARLRISSATVKSHVSHSLTKLGARNRLEAVLLMQGR